MPGLIRGVARTAAIVGTANAVSRNQQQRWAAKDQQAAQAAAYQQQYAQPQYAPPPQQYVAAPAPVPVEQDSTVAELNQLAALHAQGVLTDEEFAQAKAKALGI